MAKLLVWATGLFFIFYGVAFIFFPTEMAMIVTGDSPKTLSGVIDLRATYGGMSLSVGIFLLMLLSKPEHLPLALVAIAIVLLSMAAGRVLGFIIEGNPNTLMYVFLSLEVIVSLIALWLYTKIDRIHDA